MEHDEFHELCQQTGVEYSASECHGILCALICTQGEGSLDMWLALIEEDAPNALNETDNKRYFEMLYTNSMQQLQSNDFSFQMLLPDDEEELSERAVAMADWCQGFLFGAGIGGIKDNNDLSDDINDLLRDLANIAQAGYDDDEDENTGESAYMELTEYIKAGVMLSFIELQLSHEFIPDDQTIH